LNNKEANIIYKRIPYFNVEENCMSKKKILVVDDHKIVRDSILFLVRKCLMLSNKKNEFEIIEGNDGVDILYNIIND